MSAGVRHARSRLLDHFRYDGLPQTYRPLYPHGDTLRRCAIAPECWECACRRRNPDGLDAVPAAASTEESIPSSSAHGRVLQRLRASPTMQVPRSPN